MPRSRSSTQVSLPPIRDVFPGYFQTDASGPPRAEPPLRDARAAANSTPAPPEPNNSSRPRAGSMNSASLRHRPYPHSGQHTPTSPQTPSLSRAAGGPPSPQHGVASGAARTSRNTDNERRHGCHLCGRAFNRPSSLAIHMNSHTGERPFGCPVCGQTFSVNSNMKRHLRTHKPDATDGIPPPFSTVVPQQGPHLIPIYRTSAPFAYPTSGSPPSLRAVYQHFSDSDSDDSTDSSGSPDGDRRDDRGVEETSASFARVSLGSYPRDAHLRRVQ